jgi:hypothetical protein
MPGPNLLQVAKGKLRNPDPFEVITGLTPDDLRQATQIGPLGSDPFLTNAPSHALAGNALANRYGTTLAQIIGMLQEVPTGLGNLQSGQPFFTKEGESGFSLPDLTANTIGTMSSPRAMAGAGDPIGSFITLMSEIGAFGPAAKGLVAEQRKSNPLTQALMALLGAQ